MRLKDIPVTALLTLVAPFLLVVLMVPNLQYMPGDKTMFESIFYGWEKVDSIPNILGIATWLILLAPCWVFAANIAQRECGSRLFMTLYRQKSRIVWYIHLCYTVSVYSILYFVLVGLFTYLTDSIIGRAGFYRPEFIKAYIQVLLFLLILVMLSVQAQLFTGRPKPGFILSFIVLLLPEIPIGMLNENYYKLPMHFPMYIRSSAISTEGYNIVTGIISLAAVLIILYISGFYSMGHVAEKIGG